MKSKLIPIAYTVAIIKPPLSLKEQTLNEIIAIIEENEFEIFMQNRKILTKEEIYNLFYKHSKRDFYEEILLELQSGESVVMVLINKNETKIDQTLDEEVKVENPITRWKKLIGDKDPAIAKTQNPNSLRAKYGTTLLKNGFHGSDDEKSANKERDIFNFPIPEKIPEFKYDKNKVSLEYILKFVFPPNLEHSNSTGRLDLIALYGPIVNYHSVDKCFCLDCIKTAKEQLNCSIKDKVFTERKRLGLTSVDMSATLSKTGATTQKKIMTGPIRLLQEPDIENIMGDLCEKCIHHVNSYTHLASGREAQHVLSDSEIKELIAEINYTDLLALLKVEKGNTAASILSTLKLTEPPEIMYTEEDIRALFDDLETDYYARYEYDHVQKVILEDRRLRIVYWVSKITHKPVEKFKNPNLITKNDSVKRYDINNPYYTTSKNLPISIYRKELFERSNDKVVDAPVKTAVFSIKNKMNQNEQDQAIERTVMKDAHKITAFQNLNDKATATNTILLRDEIPNTKHVKWNDVFGLKGQSKGHYVNYKK